jgi:signal transduction histidine kinase
VESPDTTDGPLAGERSRVDLGQLEHDLRGPLNAVLGFGRLLEAEGLTPEQRECVEQIVIGGERLQAVIAAALGRD